MHAELTAATDDELAVLRRALLRHARATVGDAGLAEDLVQDCLIVVVQKQDTRCGEATLTTWAKAVLRHKIADWYRSPDHRRLRQLDGEEDLVDEAGDALFTAGGSYAHPVSRWEQPEGRMERRQMMDTLELCIDHLPERSGRLFLMREWLGFETPEICHTLGISADNCRTILHRARMSLRACMTTHWGKAS